MDSVLAFICVVVSLACGTAAGPDIQVTTHQEPSTPVGLLGQGDASLTAPSTMGVNQSAQVVFGINLVEPIDRASGVEFVSGGGNPRHVVVQDGSGSRPPEVTIRYRDVAIYRQMRARLDAPSFHYDELGWVERHVDSQGSFLWSWNIRPLPDVSGIQVITVQVEAENALLVIPTTYVLITLPQETVLTIPPIIDYTPSALSFGFIEGRGNPEPAKISVWNAGGENLKWSVKADQAWINLDPHFGSSNGPEDKGGFTVVVNADSLVPGYYSGKAIIEAGDSPRINHEVPIGLTVREPPPGIFWPMVIAISIIIGIVAGFTTILPAASKLLEWLWSKVFPRLKG